MSATQRFFLIFALTLVLQTFIWNHAPLTDQAIWARRITTLIPHELTPASIIDQEYSSTPGTVTLFLGQVILHTGATPIKSLHISVSLLVALAAASAASIAYSIKPQTWWWAAVAILIAAHPIYLQASPVDAVATPLIAVSVLVFLWYERRQGAAPLQQDLLLACLLGATLATRLHIAALVFVPALTLLSRIVAWQRIFIITGTMLAVTIALNPYLGYIPGTYLRVGVFGDTLSYVQASVARTSITPIQVAVIQNLPGATSTHTTTPAQPPLSPSRLLFTFFALLSAGIAASYLFVSPLAQSSPVSKRFIRALFAISALVVLTLAVTGLYIPRYFFPVVLTWEIFLPLFLLHLFSQTRFMHLRQHFVQNLAAVGLTAGASIALLLYTLLLPVSQSFPG